MKHRSLYSLSVLLLFLLSGLSAEESPKLLVLDGHNDEVLVARFLEGGFKAATASKDGSIKIWDLLSGRLDRNISDRSGLKVYESPPHFLGAAFTPDGKEAVAISRSDSKLYKIHRFELKTGKVLESSTFERDFPPDAVLQTDGEYLYFLTGSEALKMSFQGEVAAKHVLTGQSWNERSLAYNKGLLAAATDDRVILLSSQTLKQVKQWPAERPKRLSLSEDNKQLACAATKHAYIWNIESGETLWNSESSESYHHQPYWVAARKQFLWGAVNLSSKVGLGLLDLTEKVPRRLDESSMEQFSSVAFTSDGEALVCGPAGNIQWLDKTFKPQKDLSRRTAGQAAFKLDPKEKVLLTGSRTGLVKLWDLTSGRVERTYQGLRAYVGYLDLSPDGRLVVASDYYHGEIMVWERASGKKMSDFKVRAYGFGTGVSYVQFVDDTHYLAFQSGNGKVFLVNANDGSESDSWDFGRRGFKLAAVHPSGRRAVGFTYGDQPEVIEWGFDSKRDLLRKPIRMTRGVNSLNYSEDGKAVIIGAGHYNVGSILRLNHQDPTEEIKEVCQLNTPVLEARERQGQIKAWTAISEVITCNSDGSNLTQTYLGSHQLGTPDWVSDRLLVVQGPTSLLFLDPEAGQYLGELTEFSNSDAWVAISRTGEFDGNETGFHRLAFEFDDTIYGVDQFFTDYFRPGILSTILKFDPSPARSVDVQTLSAKNIKKPPKVEILSPASGTVLEQADVEVVLKLEDQGSGLSKVGLFHNGHRLPLSQMEQIDDTTYKFKVKAVKGKNELYATAFDKSGSVEAKRDRVRILAPDIEARKPRLHLLAVGVNDYQSGMTLRFAEDDASSVGKLFQTDVYDSGERRILIGKQATLAAILSAVKEISINSEPQDALVVYLAGHGTVIGETYYFLPHDVDILSDQSLAASSLSADQLAQKLSEVPATKQLLILDSCRSGAAGQAVGRYLASRSGLEEIRSQQMLARASGTFLIAASKAEEYAYEISDLGHGVLTFAILDALGVKPSGEERSGEVTANGLLRAVSEKVPDLSEKYNGVRQQVIQYSSGQDFPLAR